MAERPRDACSSTVISWLRFSKGVGHFERKFQTEGGVAHQPLLVRVRKLECGIKISAVHCLVLSQNTHVTDRRKDGQNYDSQDRASIDASRGKSYVPCFNTWLIAVFRFRFTYRATSIFFQLFWRCFVYLRWLMLVLLIYMIKGLVIRTASYLRFETLYNLARDTRC